MNKAVHLNELLKDTPFYMATRDFEVADEEGNIVAVEHYDILLLVQRKVYTNTVKHYMCKAKKPTPTCIIVKSGDAVLNYLIEIKFVE